MKNISFRLVSFLLGLVALTVVSNTRSARAETPNTELSVKLSEPTAAADPEVASIVTPTAIGEPLAIHSTASVVSSKLSAAADSEVVPTVATVTTSEPLENYSTVALEPPKPAKVSLREVETAETLVATSKPLEKHSTVSLELPKLATAPVQVVKSAATTVATSEPLEKHSTVSLKLPKPSVAVQAVEPDVTPHPAVEPLAVNPTFTKIPEDMTGQGNIEPVRVADTIKNQPDSQKRQSEVSKNDQLVSSKTVDAALVAKPIPGTVATSATLLTGPVQTSPQPKASSNPADSTVAQTEIQPGQATRGGRSYIGIGGNIGFSGDTTAGKGAFAIISKIGLTRFLSARPSILIGDDVDFLIPLTYDFTIESDDPFAPIPFAPFLGGGIAISTSSNSNIGFLLTGGVDVPLSREFVANATLNAAFLDNTTDVGVVIGVGYTFPNFIR